jgi:hypothetical protein
MRFACIAMDATQIENQVEKHWAIGSFGIKSNSVPLRKRGGKARRAWGTLALQTARIVVHIRLSEASSRGHSVH